MIMKFNELKQQVKSLGLTQLREETDSYLEAVIVKDMAGHACRLLEESLGPPVKSPSPQIKDVIKECGGIMPGQTLYFNNHENNIVFAMLWPWSDGVHITLKVVKQGK